LPIATSGKYQLPVEFGFQSLSIQLNKFETLEDEHISFLKKIFKKKQQNPASAPLFEGDDAEFKKRLKAADVYFEYGCGSSTKWVCGSTSAAVYAVDTSNEWIEKTKQDIGSRNNVFLHHVDLGPLGEWGRPLSYERRQHIPTYVGYLWSLPVSPDVVLVDGRFRVSCFLTSLIEAKPGTTLIFDDYTNRPLYHLVEDYIAPVHVEGRQAVFEVPEISIARKAEIKTEAEKFSYVID